MSGVIETVIGLENHIDEGEFAGDAWISHPDGTVVPSASGFPVDNLNSADLTKLFRSADLTLDSTSLIRRFEAGEPRRLGSAFLNQTNLSEKAVVEFFAGERVAERTVELEASASEYLESGLVLDATEDFTFYWRGLIRPALVNDYAITDQIAFFGSADGLSTVDFFIYLDPTASPTEVVATAPRYGGSPGVLLQGAVDYDGLTEYEIVFRVRNSDTTAELIINGVQQEITTSNDAHFSPDKTGNQIRIGEGSARITVLEAQLWDTWIEDLDILRNAKGPENGCRLLWRMNGATTQVLDLTPNAIHGTIVGGSARGKLWRRSTSKVIKQAFGASQHQKALVLSGAAAASVTRTVTATRPRSFTAEFKVVAQSSTMSFDPSQIMFSAVSANDCSFRVSTIGEIRLWIRGGWRYSFGTSLDDGLTHRIRVAVDGHLDTYAVDVDGVEVSTGACGAYATSSNFSVVVSSHVGVGFTLWDARLYGAVRRSNSSAWRPVSPHEDPETLILLPLDGHVVDRVSDVAATIVGTVEYETVTLAANTPRPAGRVGEGKSADQANGIPRNVDAWWTAELCQESAVVIFDPGNSDGYIEITTLGIFSTLVPRISRSEGRTLSRVSATARFTPGMIARYRPEPEHDLHSLSLGSLDRDEANELFERLDRAKGSKRPIMVVITSWSADVFRPWESVYGLIVRSRETLEGKGQWYSKKITVVPLALSDWR